MYGRHRTRELTDGKVRVDALPRDEWHTLLVDARDGYITWDEYVDNQRRLREHAQESACQRSSSRPSLRRAASELSERRVVQLVSEMLRGIHEATHVCVAYRLSRVDQERPRSVIVRKCCSLERR